MGLIYSQLPHIQQQAIPAQPDNEQSAQYLGMDSYNIIGGRLGKKI